MPIRKTGVELEILNLNQYISGLQQASAANTSFVASGQGITRSATSIATALGKISTASAGLQNIGQSAQGLNQLSNALNNLKNVAPLGIAINSVSNGLNKLATSLNKIGSQNLNNTVIQLTNLLTVISQFGSANAGLQALNNLKIPNLSAAINQSLSGSGGGSFISGLGSALSGAFSGAINFFKQGVFGTIGNIGSGIASALGKGLSAIGNIAGGAINNIVSKLTFGLVNNFTSLIGNIASKIPSVLGSAISGIGNLLSGLARGIGSVVSTITSGIGSAVSGIASVVGNIASGIGSAISGVFSALTSPISSIASSLGGTFGNVFSIAAGTVIGNLLTNSITGAVNAAVGAAQAAINQIQAAIKVGADFQQNLANVESDLTNLNPNLATGRGVFDPQQAQLLSDTIRNIALDPKLVVGFKEAAQGAQTLTRYGYSLESINQGALEATVLLQNATGSSFQLAAETLAKYGELNNVAPTDLVGAVGQITATISKGGFRDLNDYRYALVNAAGELQTFGVAQDDINTLLAASNPLFSSGRQNGTAFRTFIEHLTPSSNKARDAMKALNLSFFDANGSFIGIEGTLGRLRKAFSGLTEEQKANYAEDIFGATGGRFLNDILNETTDASLAQTKAIIKNADAYKAAQVRTNTFNAKLKNLGDAFEALQANFSGATRTSGPQFLQLLTAPLEQLQQSLLKLSPYASALGLKLATALVPASEALTNFLAQLNKGGSAFSNFKIGDIFKGFIGADFNKLIFGAGIDLKNLKITGGIDLSKKIFSGSVNIADFIKLGGGIDLTKGLIKGGIQIGDLLNITGAIDLKQYIANTVLAIGDWLTIAGSIDLKSKVAAIALDLNNFLSLSGSIDLSKYIANFTFDLGKLSVSGALSGKGASLNLNGVEFKLDTASLLTAYSNLEAAFTPILGFFASIGSKLAGALGFTQTLTPALDGLNSATQTAPTQKIVDIGNFIVSISEIPGKIEAALAGLTLPNIAETLKTKIQALIPSDFTFDLPDIAQKLKDAIKLPDGFSLDGLDLSSKLSSITDAFNKVAGAVGLADLAIQQIGSETGALGQIRTLITTTVQNISQSLATVDPAKALGLGMSISGSITSVLNALTTLSNLGNANVGTAVQALSNVTTGLLNFVTGVTTGLNGKEIGTSAVNFVKSFIDEFTIALSPQNFKAINIAEAAGGLIQALSAQFKDALAPGNLTGIGASLGDLSNTLIGQISSVLSDPKFANQLGQSFANILTGITQGLSDVLAGFNDKALEVDQTGKLQSGIGSFIQNFLTGIAQGLAAADYGSVVAAFVGNLFKSILAGNGISQDIADISQNGAGIQNVFKLIKDLSLLGNPAGQLGSKIGANIGGTLFPETAPNLLEVTPQTRLLAANANAPTEPMIPVQNPADFTTQMDQLRNINNVAQPVDQTASAFDHLLQSLSPIGAALASVESAFNAIPTYVIKSIQKIPGLSNFGMDLLAPDKKIEQNAVAITGAGQSAVPKEPLNDLGLGNASVQAGQMVTDASRTLASTLTDAAATIASAFTLSSDQLASARQTYANYQANQTAANQAQGDYRLYQDAKAFQIPQPTSANTAAGGGAGGFGQIDTTTATNTLTIAATAAGSSISSAATTASADITAGGSSVKAAGATASASLATVTPWPGWTKVVPPITVPTIPPFPGWDYFINTTNVPNPPSNQVLGFAKGTASVPQTGTYLVGERGPELVTLQKGSMVTPNHKLGNIIGAYATGTPDQPIPNAKSIIKSTKTAIAGNNISVPVVVESVDASNIPPLPAKVDPKLAPNALANTPPLPLNVAPKLGPNTAIARTANAPASALGNRATNPAADRSVDRIDEIINTIADQDKKLASTLGDVSQFLSKIPGIGGLSPVTADQMNAAKNGIPQNFADDFVRRLGAEVTNKNQEFGNLLPQAIDALNKIGVTPAGSPEAILQQIKDTWTSGQLFSNAENLKLVNLDAIQASVKQQQSEQLGSQNLQSFLQAAIGGAAAELAGLPGAQASSKRSRQSAATGGPAPTGGLDDNGQPIQVEPLDWMKVIPAFPAWNDKIVAKFPGWELANGKGFVPILDWADFVPAFGKAQSNQTGEQPAKGSNTTTTTTPKKATGTNNLLAYARGTNNVTALVGERGPELAQLPTGSRIFPNRQTNKIMSIAEALANSLGSVYANPLTLLRRSALTVNAPQNITVNAPTNIAQSTDTTASETNIANTLTSAVDTQTDEQIKASKSIQRSASNTASALTVNIADLVTKATTGINSVLDTAQATTKNTNYTNIATLIKYGNAVVNAINDATTGITSSDTGQIIGGPITPASFNRGGVNSGSTAGSSQGSSAAEKLKDSGTTSPNAANIASAINTNGSGTQVVSKNGGTTSLGQTQVPSTSFANGRVSQPQTQVVVRPIVKVIAPIAQNKSVQINATVPETKKVAAAVQQSLLQVRI